MNDLKPCPHRKQDGNQLTCTLVSLLAGIDVEKCSVGADACGVCEQHPMTGRPNKVVTSMILNTVRREQPDKLNEAISHFRQYLDPPAPPAPVGECIYRGEVLREEKVKPCKNAEFAVVYRCGVHGECTLRNCGVRRQLEGEGLYVNACSVCEDMKAPQRGNDDDAPASSGKKA